MYVRCGLVGPSVSRTRTVSLIKVVLLWLYYWRLTSVWTNVDCMIFLSHPLLTDNKYIFDGKYSSSCTPCGLDFPSITIVILLTAGTSLSYFLFCFWVQFYSTVFCMCCVRQSSYCSVFVSVSIIVGSCSEAKRGFQVYLRFVVFSFEFWFCWL